MVALENSWDLLRKHEVISELQIIITIHKQQMQIYLLFSIYIVPKLMGVFNQLWA